jgi:hypothetical protein
VNGRALTLAISLLSASLASVGISACGILYFGDCGGWDDSWAIELGTTADLFAVRSLYLTYPELIVAVGAAGTVVAWGQNAVTVSTVGDATLRSVWVDEFVLWVVGDGGMAAVSNDRGLNWTIVELGTSADLYEIISVGSRLVVVGDDVVLVQAADGVWSEVTPPAGGWGKLRAVHETVTRTYAVGLDGVVWSTMDPAGEWVRESAGVAVDLFDVGQHGEHVAIVGAGGTLVVRDGEEWSRAKTGVDVDLIGWSDGFVLGTDGQLYDVTSERELEYLETFPGARALVTQKYGGEIVVGDGGMARSKYYVTCEGGRPFTVDGERCRPSLDPIAEQLACKWAQDGLHEHASVASFARFGLELLALGAPAQLLNEQLLAASDELRHARLCFALARRFGGVAVRPGAMPMPRGALDRAGDPVATALGVFEEGCVNESSAACEAAHAAELATDPEVRAVLEQIAADERRHATAAWVALRWLIATHGERVRGPLRTRLAQLGPVSEIHRRVHVELIQPIARSMLEAP